MDERRKVIFDRMVWMLTSKMTKFEYAKLTEQDLVLQTEDRGFGTTKVNLCEDYGDIVGIPRQFFLSHYNDGELIFDNTIFPEKADFPDFKGELRSGQDTAVRDVMMAFQSRDIGRYGGLLEAKCGQGKTVTALYILSKMKTPTVVMLHKTDLLDQWYEEIKGGKEKEGFLPNADVGIVRQDKQDFVDKDIVLASIGTLNARYDELTKKGFFKNFGMVVVDEAHHVPAETFESIVKAFPAKIRLGLSATFRRKDGLDNVFYWHIGKILTRMKSISMKAEYSQIQIPSSVSMKELEDENGNVNMNQLITRLTEDSARNKVLLKIIRKAIEKDRRLVVVTGRKDHAKELEQTVRTSLLSEGGFASVGLYIGGMKKEEYEKAKKLKVLIATYNMLGEGTDIPDMDCILLATPKSDVEQVIGRIQRVKPGKERPYVLDVIDEGLSPCIAMGKKRLSQYKEMEMDKKEK